MKQPVYRRALVIGTLSFSLLLGLWVSPPAQAVEAPETCTWTVGDFGCSIERDSVGSVVVYTYLLSPPTVSGIHPPSCTGHGPNGAQVCTSTSTSLTVTASAPFESSGTLHVGL